MVILRFHTSELLLLTSKVMELLAASAPPSWHSALRHQLPEGQEAKA